MRHLDHTRDLALIAEIYDHVGDAGAIGYLMPRIAEHLGSAGSFWYVLPRAGARPFADNPYLFDGHWNFSDADIQRYHNEMWRYDPTLHLTGKTDWTTETHEILSPQEIDRSGFLRWMEDVAGVNRRISRTTEVGDGLIGGWSFHMPSDRVRDPRERTSFDRIAPHIARAFRVTALFGETDARISALEASIDASGRATLLLDRQGRVVWASAAALAIVASEDGLTIRSGLFGPARLTERQQFDAMLRRLVRPAIAEDAPALLKVSRISGRAAFVLDLVPAPNSFRQVFRSGACVLVTIHDPCAKIDPRPVLWRDLFGLTLSESRVAALSMEGLQDGDMATRLCLGVGTVRSHLRQILAKTGCRSKAELAHLLTRSV
ncbi:MAG: helix-turn-helix transcriptional regulator [Sphingomonas sp.]|uniref:helix-turn-helix transcriptional regulator n=1 Tax=Sphingomonas sp. TaxID=28214 RepID=UPI0025F58D02|nr:helix-turn-helix transcriptional regulator [Sphingomonas sp.]MBX3564427.1 helix-turn-helix transcriptional regulator [Sphingomonas sp.]